jgi:hypothetical protein
MLENEIKQYLRKAVHDMGGICLNFNSPGYTGVPDKLVLYRGNIFCVELKQPCGRLSLRQKRVIEKFSSVGVKVYVLKSIDEVKQFIEDLKNKF